MKLCPETTKIVEKIPGISTAGNNFQKKRIQIIHHFKKLFQFCNLIHKFCLMLDIMVIRM